MRKQLAVPEEICLFIRLSLIRHSTKKGVFAYAEYYLMNVNSAKPAIKIITCEYSCLSSLLVARDVPGDVPSSEERGEKAVFAGYQDQRGNLNSAFVLLNLRAE